MKCFKVENRNPDRWPGVTPKWPTVRVVPFWMSGALLLSMPVTEFITAPRRTNGSVWRWQSACCRYLLIKVVRNSFAAFPPKYSNIIESKDNRSQELKKQWFLESLGANGAHLDFVITLPCR